jgi:hypothetical protein
MIRSQSFNTLGLATVAVSLALRLEPQEVEMLATSTRQAVIGWHTALLGLIGVAAVRARTSSTSMDTEFAEAGILRDRSGPYLAAINDRKACRFFQPASLSPFISGDFR